MKRYFLAAAAVFCAAGFARAASVTVTEIKASGSGGEVTVDSRLSDIRDSIVRQFRFSNYEFLSRRSSNITQGATTTWKLATGDYLDVTLTGDETSKGSRRYTLTLLVYNRTSQGKRTILNTTVKTQRGQVFLVGLGENAALGGTLILAMQAE